MCTYSMQVHPNVLCANNYETTNSCISKFKNNLMSKVMKKGKQKIINIKKKG
jgi:hypothetical protein